MEILLNRVWENKLIRILLANKWIGSASVYVVGSFLQRAAEFLLIPLWTRFLSPVDYGITGTMSAYSGALFVFFHLNLYAATTRFYFDDLSDNRRQRINITSIFAFQLAVGLIVVILLNLIGSKTWNTFVGNDLPYNPFVWIMLWTTYLRSWVQIPITLYQAQQKPKQFMSVQYVTLFVSIISGLIFVVGLKMGAVGQMLSQLIAAGIIAIVSVFLIFRGWFYPKFDWIIIRKAVQYSFPLIPHALAAWALVAADRVILQRYVSLEEVGLYNIGYTFGMIMQVLVLAINQAWSPYYFKMMGEGHEVGKKIANTVSIYIVIIGAISVVGTTFLSDVVYLIMPKRFVGGIPYIGPVLLGYVFLGLYYFTVSPIFYYKKTRFVPLLTGSAAVINILLNLLFVPRFGAIASAWVTTLTYGILLIFTYIFSNRIQHIPYSIIKQGLILLLILIFVVASRSLPVLSIYSSMVKIMFLFIYGLFAYFLLLAPILKSSNVNSSKQV